ncbi:MAG: FAD-dependent oxidoreductase, partial [Rhodospirillaceae bacterium]|nr:FAD-dependent oxidoreductase [Rhodospirillaceae bacterium]
GYDVHLREADGEVGGHLRNVMRYPGLAEWGRVISYREGQIAKLSSVELHTGVGQMSADDILSYGADKVVIAIGAHWAEDGLNAVGFGPIEGADASQPQFCTPEQIMAGKEVGDRVVVIDGDGYFTGAAMAEMMADQGKQVSIVTQFQEVAPFCQNTLEGPNLQRLLHEKNIEQHLLHWIEDMTVDNSIKMSLAYAYRDGAEIVMPPKTGELPRRASTEVTNVECDTVILCTARKSNTALFTELKSRKAEWADNEIDAVYHVGDCHTPRFIQLSVFEAHRMAREFESKNPQYPLPFIREQQIWGGPNYPKLG